MFDNNHNGKVDQVKAVFTNATVTSSCSATWTALNIPSGGTINSAGITVATGTNTVTIPINEGAGAADTSVGLFTVTFAPGAGCNASAFGPATPTDLAPPVAVTITSANHAGGTAGLMELTDTLTITFSEPMTGAPASTPAVMDDNSANDNLNITGITNGNNASGGDYENGKTATFSAATVALSNANKTITVTIAGTCSGSGSACSKLTAGGPGNLTYVPATTLTDVPGNAAVANAGTPTVNLRLF
jgi:hypothetical protein